MTHIPVGDLGRSLAKPVDVEPIKLSMRFTGLASWVTWTSTKRADVLLASGLPHHARHSASLTIDMHNVWGYGPDESTVPNLLSPDRIVLGVDDHEYGIWFLDDRHLHVLRNGEPQDPPSFTVYESGPRPQVMNGKGTGCPSSDADWKNFWWVPDLKAANLPYEVDPQLLTANRPGGPVGARVTLLEGIASGMKPSNPTSYSTIWRFTSEYAHAWTDGVEWQVDATDETDVFLIKVDKFGAGEEGLIVFRRSRLDGGRYITAAVSNLSPDLKEYQRRQPSEAPHFSALYDLMPSRRRPADAPKREREACVRPSKRGKVVDPCGEVRMYHEG